MQPEYHRHVNQSVTDNCWVCLANGTVALDLFLLNEEYVNTFLIDGSRIKGVEITADYKYRIRNLSRDSVTVRYYRETDSGLK